MPFPESVQALIAARLDTLEPEAKSLLADAAVIGKVFWAGAVAAMGERDPQTVIAAPCASCRARSSCGRPGSRRWQGEAEYAFWHVLARDVAYDQLPRASRAARHVAAANWIESKAPERVEDLADVLAYHYATALELARAAGQTEQADRARGARACGSSPSPASARSASTPPPPSRASSGRSRSPRPGTPSGPRRSPASARPRSQPDATPRRHEALEEAIASFRAAAMIRSAAARAMGTLGERASSGSAIRARWTLPAEAVALLEPLPPGPELVGRAHRARPRREPHRGRARPASGYAERALALAGELGLARPARALGYRGLARCDLGDRAGSTTSARRSRSPPRPGRDARRPCCTTTSGWTLWAFEGRGAALEVMRAGIAFAQARGLTEVVDCSTGSTLDALVDQRRAR